MGTYQIVVYAICRDEAQFARRWMESMAEADQIVVLDTGSTDDTPALLHALGAQVTQEKIDPWRFDAARNRSLALVPEDADICVCTDLDELFCPGWRKALEQAWCPGVGQARYPYIWSFRPDGADGVSFWADKIHSRRGWHWVSPVHEVLRSEHPVRTVFVPDIRLEHHPDPKKSRSQYLPLLELAVAEEPDNDRSMHYLGREYLFHGRWKEAEAALRRHLQMPTAVWPEERCASMRYLARCARELGREGEEERWLLRACAEAPELREPWLDLAQFLFRQENWHGVIWAARRALRITKRTQSYLTEPEAWGELPYDLLAVALYYLGDYRHALAMGEEALKRSPMDTRLRDNVRLMRKRAVNFEKNAGT